MADTLLILTQTLTSVCASLSQTFILRPALPVHVQPMPEAFTCFPGVEVTSLPALSYINDRSSQVEYTVSLKLKRLWLCLYENAKKVYIQHGKKKFDRESYQKSVLVLNIVQSKLQSFDCDLHQGVARIRRSCRLYLDGLYLKAVQVWKCEVTRCLVEGHGKKKVAQNLHSILYTYLLYEGFSGITSFVDWLSCLLRSFLCPKKQSSLKSNLSKAVTKAGDGIGLSFESSKIDQTPKIDSEYKAAIKADRCETQVPAGRYLFKEGIHGKSRIYTYSSMEQASSQECAVKPKTVLWMIGAVRQVVGSLGRILALEALGCYPDVPAPHKPHAIPPLWTSVTQPQGVMAF